MTCPTCKCQFRDGEQITAKVVSVYHDLEKAGIDGYKYAIEKPHVVLSVAHLVCNE